MVKTAQEITAAILNRIARGEFLLQLGGIIREVARKMEGKRADKRFHTAVKARISEILGAGLTVYWSTEYGRLAVEVWGGGINTPDHMPKQGDRASFLIARPARDGFLSRAQETISEAYIVAENQAYFLEAERLPKLREALDAGKPALWASQLATIEALRKALGEDATAYGVQYLLSK